MVKYAVTHAVWNHGSALFPQRKGRSSCVTTATLLKATTSLVKTETIIKSYTNNEFSLLCHILPRIPRGKTCSVIHSFRQPVTGLKHTCSRQYRLYVWIGYFSFPDIWIALLTVNSRIQNLRPNISLFSGSLSIFLYTKLSVKRDFVQATSFWKLRLCEHHYPGGMAPLAVPMVTRWVPGRLRLFCPLMVRAWWPWEDEREGITGEQGKLELDRGDCIWSALACPPPMLMLLLFAPGDIDVADQRDVPAKVLLCLTIVRVPAVPALPAAPL